MQLEERIQGYPNFRSDPRLCRDGLQHPGRHRQSRSIVGPYNIVGFLIHVAQSYDRQALTAERMKWVVDRDLRTM